MHIAKGLHTNNVAYMTYHAHSKGVKYMYRTYFFSNLNLHIYHCLITVYYKKAAHDTGSETQI